QAEDGIRDLIVTGVQTCALPILAQDVRPDLGQLRLHWTRLHNRRPEDAEDLRGAICRGVADTADDAGQARDLLKEASGCDSLREIGRASCRERGYGWVGTE